MADTKLSALSELATTPANDDEVYIRDVSEAAADESKRITIANLMAAGGGGATVVRKTADQSINNNIVPQNDPDLLFPVGANEIWQFLLYIRAKATHTTPDLRFVFAIPTAGTLYRTSVRTIASDEKDGTSDTIMACELTTEYWFMSYLYIGAGNAGNVQLQWANSSAGEPTESTILEENTFIVAHQLG